MRRSSVLILALLAGGASAGAAPDTLLVTYIEKPPFYATDAHGKPQGFLFERTRAALAEAGITARFESRPPSRALHELREGSEPACSIGWFHTEERARYVRYSPPIYRDRPLLAVTTPAHADEYARHGSLAAMLAVPGVRIGTVAGYSYGDDVDRLLQTLSGRNDPAPNPAANLAKLLAGRFDLALFNSEDLDYLIAQSPEHAARIVRLPLADVPPGRTRHLICSRTVPPEEAERIDRAIIRLRFNQP